MSTTTPQHQRSHHSDSSRGRSRRSLGKAIATAAVGSVLVNAVIAAVARGPLDVSADFQPLDPPVFMMWTVLGVVIGALGWRLILKRGQQPARLLRRLVPTVLVLSLIPDLALYVSDSIPGTSGTSVLPLVAMHLATAAAAVTAYCRFLPAGR